jgi:MFS family permease
MTPLLITVGLTVAVSGAIRSTWSPCGLSMLSSLTPLAEIGRGHRYRTTVVWFIIGGVIGGCALGALGAGLAVGMRALGPPGSVVLGIVAAVALIAVASDLELFGFHLPVHHRQVNERWLDQFRPWVYGIGFGMQIGSGLATYIMTSALYLLLVIAALSQSVALALTLGVVFGLVRGLAVLLGRTITSPDTLRSFHRHFSTVGPRVRTLTISVESGCAGTCVLALWTAVLPAVIAGAVLGIGVFFLSGARSLYPDQAPDQAPASSGSLAS